jgi:rhodanese-related sulfurtransferase
MSLNQQDVVQIMKDPRAVVLNVLPEEEFRQLHIEGSRNIPWTPDRGAFSQAVEKKFGKRRFFVVYGSNITSHAGIDAVEALRERGFRADVFLSGMKGWVEAALPAVGTRLPQPLSPPVRTLVLDP